MNVSLNDVAQLNISVTDNGTAMNPLPALTYMSSDSSVLAVDFLGGLEFVNPTYKVYKYLNHFSLRIMYLSSWKLCSERTNNSPNDVMEYRQPDR